MQEDIFPAAEKILSDIENVVKKDSLLKGFEIIPAEDNENRSPVFHQEEFLGLASWCVQPLYCYAYRRLLDYRQNKHRREESSTVARWLLGALLLNPDVTTFWNMRRELARNHKLDPSEELSFARLVLYHKPKCFEAFAYRRWLLPYILDAKDKTYDPSEAESPLCAEINIAETCADRYANNYHAWSHRRYVMTLRESRGYTHPTYKSEWKSTLTWSQRHVSDYSVFSYRQFLLKKCMLESKVNTSETMSNKCTDVDRGIVLAYIEPSLTANTGLQKLLRNSSKEDLLKLIHGKTSVLNTVFSDAEHDSCFRALSYLIEECQTNENLIKMYNNHEALWSHRRYLAHLLVQLITSYKKYRRYHDHIIDSRVGIRSQSDLNETNLTSDDESKYGGSSFLEIAFLYNTRTIIEIAGKRSHHEKSLADKFVKFLLSIGLEI